MKILTLALKWYRNPLFSPSHGDKVIRLAEALIDFKRKSSISLKISMF